MTYLPDLPDIEADLSEFKPDEHLEAIRQQHEPFLTRLEALAVMVLASGDWSQVRDLINDFKDYQDDSNSIERMSNG